MRYRIYGIPQIGLSDWTNSARRQSAVRGELVSIDDKLSPIAQSFTLKDHTFDVLRAAILEMDIYNPEADLRLDERKLAERLNISRTIPDNPSRSRSSFQKAVSRAPANNPK